MAVVDAMRLGTACELLSAASQSGASSFDASKNLPATSHDLAVEATRFEGFPKATNAKMVVEEGMFSREVQDVLRGCRILGELSQHAVAGD